MATTAIVVVLLTTGIFSGAVFYAIGYKDGERNGYTRGRSISRHISTTAKAVK
jgi:hypothetical protein